MLLGQSVFQSVLTRLKDEQVEEEAEENGPSFRISGLGTGFVAETAEGPTAAAANELDAYFAFPAEPDIAALPEEQTPAPLAEAPPPVPAHLLRLTPEEIAADLALGPDETAASLAEKRRLFAKANHPDGVPEEFRDSATIRMQTANLLIDRAIRELSLR